MLEVYLNYPNARVTVHRNMECGSIRQMDKARQRRVRINDTTRERELRRFQREHAFGANAAINDMWVTLDLGNVRDEQRFVKCIVSALGRRYGRFQRVDVDTHCEDQVLE